jgi:hypothetical protein
LAVGNKKVHENINSEQAGVFTDPGKEDRMKKTVVILMTACVLFCLSPQLMGKVWVIEIKVLQEPPGRFYIDMGEKYAFAVPPGDTIRWTCDSAFEIIFDQKTPFETMALSTRAIEKRLNAQAPLLQMYKYTVNVPRDDIKLTLDPVIIVKPPRG